MSSTNNPSPETDDHKPIVLVVLGMAGSGKTTFVQKLVEHLTITGGPPYTINLDPAVYHVPYHVNVDIRDTVKYKEVMKQYGLGPNGSIITSLNFYTAHFDKVLSLIDKNSEKIRHVVIDTPGQIEVFTWSASGIIITEALSSSYPTVIVYVMDTPRSHNPVTFMSNMLYACSVLYRMKLPFICVMNKTDIIDCGFAVEWMRDFEAFQSALSNHRGSNIPEMSDQFDSDEAGGEFSDSSQYMTGLTSSMSLVLDEFYSHLKSCGVSSITGDGFEEFVKHVADSKREYFEDFWPMLKAKKSNMTGNTSLLSRSKGSRGSHSEEFSVDKDRLPSPLDVEFSSQNERIHGDVHHKNQMLVDMIGNTDEAETDVLVNIDGVEEKPYEIDEEDFQKICSLGPT